MRWGHADSWMFRFWWGNSLRLGAPPPNHVSSSPSPSSLKQTLFAIFGPYGPIYFAARAPTSSTYRPLAARKLTRRRFVFGGTASENLCATAPASLRYQIADVSGPPSSLRPGAPRIWTHLIRICKKQMEKDHKWKTNNCFLNES